MVVITRKPDGAPSVWCDPCIAPIVAALNAAGIATVASCCGHGEQLGNIALADGRELIIARNFEAARAIESPRFDPGTDIDVAGALVEGGRFVCRRACVVDRVTYEEALVHVPTGAVDEYDPACTVISTSLDDRLSETLAKLLNQGKRACVTGNVRRPRGAGEAP
jgi:hypothetical protein